MCKYCYIQGDKDENINYDQCLNVNKCLIPCKNSSKWGITKYWKLYYAVFEKKKPF